MESKYRWRSAARKCPSCGKETIIKGKEEYGGGFVCFGKKGGCGAKFKDDDPAIIEQPSGKIENTDIADTCNTVIKMSKKRAYVDAVITACAASDIFTQDAEDLNDTAGTGELAREAAENVWAKEKPSKTDPAQERAALMKAIGEILYAKNHDGLPWFTDSERAQERAVIKGAAGIQAVRNQYKRLEQQLAKREAEYKPVPFDGGQQPNMSGMDQAGEEAPAKAERDIF
jgi:hypothetical protein